MSTTRRTILTGLAASPLAAVPAVAAVTETPEERLIRLTNEYMAAAAEVYPAIDGWLAMLDGENGGHVIIHGMSYAGVESGRGPSGPLLYRKRTGVGSTS